MMKKTSVCRPLLVLACLCLSTAAGCDRSDGPQGGASKQLDVEAHVGEIKRFTDELLKKVESNSDPSAGLDEAQRMLDANRDAFRERIAKVRASAEYRESEAARGKLLECEIDNTDRVSKLRTLYLEQWMRDTAFKSKLDKLVGDYQDLFK